MPKDEFDPDDPLELNGLAFLTQEDTTDVMCECFIEEFMRMGYNPKQILALFRNPQYLGMNLVLEKPSNNSSAIQSPRSSLAGAGSPLCRSPPLRPRG